MICNRHYQLTAHYLQRAYKWRRCSVEDDVLDLRRRPLAYRIVLWLFVAFSVTILLISRTQPALAADLKNHHGSSHSAPTATHKHSGGESNPSSSGGSGANNGDRGDGSGGGSAAPASSAPASSAPASSAPASSAPASSAPASSAPA